MLIYIHNVSRIIPAIYMLATVSIILYIYIVIITAIIVILCLNADIYHYMISLMCALSISSYRHHIVI